MMTATMETTALKLTCNAKAMLDAIKLAGSIVRPTSPSLILQNVKVEVDGDGAATICSSDAEVQIRVAFEVDDSSGTGAMLLPPDKVVKILAKAESPQVSFEVAGTEILVVDGRSKFRLPSEDPDKFPAIDPVDAPGFHEVQAEDLSAAIKRTLHASDAEGVRKAVYAGLHVVFGPTALTVVGMDGLRLARMVVPCSSVGEVVDPEGRPSVPVKAMKTIERLCGEHPVLLCLTTRNLLVKSGPVELTCRLIEGSFPRYEAVTDNLPKVMTPFLASELANAVERAGITVSEESMGIEFRFGDGEMALSSRASGKGSSQVVTNSMHEGEAESFMLNHRYVEDALKTVPGESEVDMGYDGDRCVYLLGRDGYLAAVNVMTIE